MTKETLVSKSLNPINDIKNRNLNFDSQRMLKKLEKLN